MKKVVCRGCKNLKSKTHYDKSQWKMREVNKPKCKQCIYKYNRRKSKPKNGVIYLIQNPAWKEWVKVGLSTNIGVRLRTINTYSPFRDFMIIFTVETDDVFDSEKRIHEKLRKMKIENNSEWFKIDTDRMIKFLNSEIKGRLL